MAAPDPPEKLLNRGDIERLHREGVLGDDPYRTALSIWDQSRNWRAFAVRWLSVLGGVFLLVGVLFFFAYNWKELHRLTRFAILQGGVLFTAIGAAWLMRPHTAGSTSVNARRLPGEILLVSAAVLTGILIAVYGQAYQTGADAFQNFIGWAALILPWVLVGRSAALWVLWLAILETGIIFFWTQVLGATGAAGFGLLFLVLGLVSLVAALSREALARRPAFAWLDHRAIRHLLFTAALTWFSFSAVRFIFNDDFRGQAAADAIGSFLFVGTAALAFWWFRLRDYDLGALLVTMLFSATLAVIGLGRLLFEVSGSNDSVVWFVMAACTLGIYGAAGVVLQRIHGTQPSTTAA